MTTCASTPTFSPIPLRALCDDRLTLLDLRVLGAIASHDRFNANSQACWASNERLAAILKCHPKSIARTITRLIKFGYVKDLGKRPGKRRSRARFLTVIYNEQDLEAFSRRPDPTQWLAEDDEPPAPKQPAADRESNPRGYFEGNSTGYSKRKGRDCAEALGSASRKMQAQRRAPPRPPPLEPPLLAFMEERNAALWELACRIDPNNPKRGFEKLKRIPDRRTEHA